MPAVSAKQRKMMAIAKYQPEKLHKKNRAVLKMGKEKLSHYASTKETKLPKKTR